MIAAAHLTTTSSLGSAQTVGVGACLEEVQESYTQELINGCKSYRRTNTGISSTLVAAGVLAGIRATGPP